MGLFDAMKGRGAAFGGPKLKAPGMAAPGGGAVGPPAGGAPDIAGAVDTVKGGLSKGGPKGALAAFRGLQRGEATTGAPWTKEAAQQKGLAKPRGLIGAAMRGFRGGRR